MPDLKETLRAKKLFLLDMDGTLYLDDQLFDHPITAWRFTHKSETVSF